MDGFDDRHPRDPLAHPTGKLILQITNDHRKVGTEEEAGTSGIGGRASRCPQPSEPLGRTGPCAFAQAVCNTIKNAPICGHRAFAPHAKLVLRGVPEECRLSGAALRLLEIARRTPEAL